MNTARQLETILLHCIATAGETAEKYTTPDQRPRVFAAALYGALEAYGYQKIADAIASGAGMDFLRHAEEA
ncbi:hypothetical protein WK91_21295 [Burkholderia cepacia]|uniref:hypothetical protein n=1 Tax=Burkholderia cepacia TaxID=292 RepID=UPI00076C99EE|nr:hypothetical protein [Burkholderia cepacia]KVW13848.1 hypothetical protein WK91_21295 [Burkholderia cepacia]